MTAAQESQPPKEKKGFVFKIKAGCKKNVTQKKKN
jgi:hypothetical protein